MKNNELQTKENEEYFGMPKEFYNKNKKLILAISQANGNVSAACRILNVPRGRLHNIINTPWMKKYIEYCREELIDSAETTLQNLLKDENINERTKLEVAKTILQTVGKQRYQDQPQVQITQNVMSDADKTIAIKNIFGITDKNDESK